MQRSQFVKIFDCYVLVTDFNHNALHSVEGNEVFTMFLSDKQALQLLTGLITPKEAFFNHHLQDNSYLEIPTVPLGKRLFADHNYPGPIYVGTDEDIQYLRLQGGSPYLMDIEEAIIDLNFPTDFTSNIEVCDWEGHEEHGAAKRKAAYEANMKRAKAMEDVHA